MQYSQRYFKLLFRTEGQTAGRTTKKHNAPRMAGHNNYSTFKPFAKHKCMRKANNQSPQQLETLQSFNFCTRKSTFFLLEIACAKIKGSIDKELFAKNL